MTEGEVKKALKGINDIVAPGIDGFESKFCKATWNIIGKDIMMVVEEFFEKGMLYKASNRTLVTLIPNTSNSEMIKDFRPISCRTTLYKIISKVLETKLGKVLRSIIHVSQEAFMQGQHIHDHILLSYELLKGYSGNRGSPRCMLQMDFQKAYNNIESGVVEDILKWVMMSITTISYKYNVNNRITSVLAAK